MANTRRDFLQNTFALVAAGSAYPFLFPRSVFAQAALLVAVLLLPQLTHIGQSAADSSRKPPAISDRDLEQRFEQMLVPAEPPPLDLGPGK